MSARLALARTLYDARRTGLRLDHRDLPWLPAGDAEAYGVASALHELRGGAVAGWKLGATSGRAQEFLGRGVPFLGRIYRDTLFASPARLAREDGELAIEAELGFRLTAGYEPGRKYARDAAAALVGELVPLIEVNRPIYREPFAAGVPAIIADNGVNAGVVLGTPLPAELLAALDTLRVEVQVNDTVAGSGTAADAGADPLAQFVWALNRLIDLGSPAEPGQLFAMGACAGTQLLESGDRVAVRFHCAGGAAPVPLEIVVAAG